jgi:threonine dehydrogenase-like Zn-dependent dehydrogenase
MKPFTLGTSRQTSLDAPLHIVVIGGGFGGLALIRALARVRRRGHLAARVTLIDRRNHHTFQPLLYQVATAGLQTQDVGISLRAILRRQDVEIRLGDVVVVIGQGAMGLSCLQVARTAGAGLTVAIARRDAVLDISRQLGADVTINATTCDPVAAVRELTAGRGADVVFETAGGPVEQGLAGEATLRQAADMLRDHGKLVGISLHGDGTLLPYAHFRHRSIRFLFPSMLDRRLFETTVRLVATGRVNVKPLITHVLSGIERVPEAFELTANKARHGLINPAQVVIST